MDVHRLLPAPFELARTKLAYGERLRGARCRAEARRELREALILFEELGAHPWAERTRTELAASGETGPASAATLTPQERRVAGIIATGATNREAAATLFVNPKTIEFHLGNVYRKLGVRSRTELAIALRRDPTDGL
ncbi:MAG: LuxR family transcriptional regulator [Actinobacteria bacterium]|nr:MAG: LuxR family transcriptional regulator [Actinomycetota bacterium]